MTLINVSKMALINGSWWQLSYFFLSLPKKCAAISLQHTFYEKINQKIYYSAQKVLWNMFNGHLSSLTAFIFSIFLLIFSIFTVTERVCCWFIATPCIFSPRPTCVASVARAADWCWLKPLATFTQGRPPPQHRGLLRLRDFEPS